MFLHAEARLLKGSLRQCLTTHSTSKKPPVRFLPHFARVPIDLFLSTLSRVLTQFSSQTRAARRQRRARQAALQGAIASLRGAVKAAVAATPASLRKAGPWATSAAANLALFALLFLYGVPRFVADTSEAIQVTVTSFFAETPPPQKPDENAGGGGGQEALEAAAASYQVASATAATMSLAAVTTVNPSALQINIPQTISKGEARLAPVSAIAKAAPTAGSGGGIGGGNGGGIGDGTGTGEGSGTGAGASAVHRIGKLRIQAEKICVILDVSGSMTRNIAVAAEEARNLAESTGGTVVEFENSDLSIFFVREVEAFAAAGADAVYWLCDLQDYQEQRCINDLSALLKKAKMKFYVSSWDKKPSSELSEAIRSSGGAFERRRPH